VTSSPSARKQGIRTRGPVGRAFVDIVRDIGVPASLHGAATMCVELLGGLAVLLGAFVPLASLPRFSWSPCSRSIYPTGIACRTFRGIDVRLGLDAGGDATGHRGARQGESLPKPASNLFWELVRDNSKLVYFRRSNKQITGLGLFH
jgi:hypothetical protein